MDYLCWINVSHCEIQQLVRPYQHFGKLCRKTVNSFMHPPQGSSTPQIEWPTILFLEVYRTMMNSHTEHDDKQAQLQKRFSCIG